MEVEDNTAMRKGTIVDYLRSGDAEDLNTAVSATLRPKEKGWKLRSFAYAGDDWGCEIYSVQSLRLVPGLNLTGLSSHDGK